MKSLNQAMIIGNVGRDAEVRYTGVGMPVATFTMATNERWKDRNSGQQQERTDWHNIVAWNKLAEICGEHVRRGAVVFVSGRIQNRTYLDKDNVKRYISEIVANEVIVLRDPQGKEVTQITGSDYPDEAGEFDNVPF